MGRCLQLWQCTRHVQTVCPTGKGGYLSAEETMAVKPWLNAECGAG